MHPAVANGSYNVNRVRADFPAPAMKVYGKPLVYLDNAGPEAPSSAQTQDNSANKDEFACSRSSCWSLRYITEPSCEML
jgi:cysteine desulfurase/selenocysteine lyase